MKHLSAAILVSLLSALSGASVAGSIWSDQAPSIPAVKLTDQDGKQWQLQELIKDRPVLINFFFTGCKAICPTQTVQMQDVQHSISGTNDHGNTPLFLSISLDPLSDTPEAIREFMAKFGITAGAEKNWLFLHGNFEDLQPVWKAFQQPVGQAGQHDALFWIGRPKQGQWTRAGALSSGRAVAELLTGNGGE